MPSSSLPAPPPPAPVPFFSRVLLIASGCKQAYYRMWETVEGQMGGLRIHTANNLGPVNGSQLLGQEEKKAASNGVGKELDMVTTNSALALLRPLRSSGLSCS